MRSLGCGSAKDTQETCYSIVGVAYDKALKTTFSLLIYHLIFIIFFIIETKYIISSFQKHKNDYNTSDKGIKEPFIDKDN